MEHQDANSEGKHPESKHPSAVPGQSSDTGDSEEIDSLAEFGDEEAFQKLPPEARGWVARLVHNFTSIGIAPTNPIHRRLTSEHISTMLTHLDRDKEREHTSQASARRYQAMYFIVALIAIISLVVFFSLRGDRETLTALGLALLGFAGGFGLGRTTGRGG